MLAKFIPICNDEIGKLDFIGLAKNCPHFKAVIAFGLYILLYDKRLILDLYHLIQKVFEIVTVNNICFATCLIFR